MDDATRPSPRRPGGRPYLRQAAQGLVGLGLVLAAFGAPGAAGAAGAPGADRVAVDRAAPARAAAATGAPNIVLISTDDQTVEELQWMPFTRSLIGGRGVTFASGLSPHPLCCPARAEVLTGQYGQNNGVHHNAGPNGGYRALRDPDNTIARWLQRAGYRTAMVGKYLNGIGPQTSRPAGWDHWNPFVGNTDFTTTTYFDDGDLTVREGHVDDVTNAYARDYVEELSGERPFFLWVSNYAPHRAQYRPGWEEYSYPAPRFQRVLTDVALPSLRKRSFNETDVSDQPSASQRPRVSPAEMQRRFTTRIQALQSADEGVRDLVATLEATGELDSTYLFFVSDNGYLLGEHRLSYKNQVYRETLEVPFAVRVPGATGPSVSRVPVTLADLAPTFAELAGATPERVVDGVSFVPVLAGEPTAWRDTQLIQTGRTAASRDSWKIRGVRTGRYTYGRDVVNGFEQLYDRRRRPSEIRNVATTRAYRPVVRELRRRTRALESCSGTACAVSFGRVPRPAR